MRYRLPAAAGFGRDPWLLMVAWGLFCASYMGLHALLSVLYILRLGHGPEYVGLFAAAGAFIFMAMSLPSGALGERLGAGRTMLIGGAISTAGMAMLPLTEAVPHWARDAWPILSQLVLVGGWAGLSVNLVPALTAATTAANRSGAFAANMAFRCLGMFLGTLVGGALPGLFARLSQQSLASPGPYRNGLWVVAAVGLAGVVTLLPLRRLKRAPATMQQEAGDKFPLLAVAIVVVHVFLVHGGAATAQSFANAYMDADLHLPASTIGLITGLAQAAATLATFAAPRLRARFGDGRVLVATAFGRGASLLPLALIPHWAAAALGRVGLQALDAVWMPTLQVFQMERVSARWRSLAYGAVSTSMGLSFGLVSLGGGLISAAVGYRTVFLLGAVLAASGAGVFRLGSAHACVQREPAARARGAIVQGAEHRS